MKVARIHQHGGPEVLVYEDAPEPQIKANEILMRVGACALNHLDYKQRGTHSYSQLFMAVSELKLGDEAIGQTFRRMTFNVMSRNCDDHTKNFSFLLKQGQNWEDCSVLRRDPCL